jgi:hypothetical protein
MPRPSHTSFPSPNRFRSEAAVRSLLPKVIAFCFGNEHDRSCCCGGRGCRGGVRRAAVVSTLQPAPGSAKTPSRVTYLVSHRTISRTVRPLRLARFLKRQRAKHCYSGMPPRLTGRRRRAQRYPCVLGMYQAWVSDPLLPKPDRMGSLPAKAANSAGRGPISVVRGYAQGTQRLLLIGIGPERPRSWSLPTCSPRWYYRSLPDPPQTSNRARGPLNEARRRTGDAILTIDARVVHDALQHLTCPHNSAGESRCRAVGRGAS